jgi:adenylate cyclase
MIFARELSGDSILARIEDETVNRQQIVRRMQILMTVLVLTAHVIGALVALSMIAFIVPGPSIFQQDLLLVDWVVMPSYIVVSLIIGAILATARTLKSIEWFSKGRTPTPDEAHSALALPFRLAVFQAAFWFGGLVLGTTIYGLKDVRMIPKVGFTVALAGVVVCSIAYIMCEIAVRPVAATALAAGHGSRKAVSGVTGRSVLNWLLGTGVPGAGLIIVAIWGLLDDKVSAHRLSAAIIAICGLGLVAGLILNTLTAWAIVAPIRKVREAMALVEQGEFDTEVVVFDGTELGELQSGFNNMAQGLRDRERIRDVFGRHVGQDVAERALADHPRLGGEERQVAIFFIDLIGSTGLAARTEPTAVVGLLNRFFAVIVEEVGHFDGFVNKFVGDAALAVFGAPTELADPAGNALAAARAIMARLEKEVPEVSAAIGIAYGKAVAGNVGAHERYEYTVIGDPVNEAARLSELAKTIPGRIVASATAVKASEVSEAVRWQLTVDVMLRGRTEPTQLAVPSA